MENFLYLPRALVSILFDIPFATAFGSLFALLWLRPDASTSTGPDENNRHSERSDGEEPPHLLSPLLRRTLGLSAVLTLIALPAQLWLLTATMLATSAPAEIRPQLYDVLTGTHAGRVLIPDFLCAALLLLAALTLNKWGTPFIAPLSHAKDGVKTGNPLSLYLCLSLAFLLAAFRSASGHAAANGNLSLSEVVQFLHLISIAIWSGGIIIAGYLVLPHLPGPAELTHFGRRLSTSATVAIVLVALSGIYNAWLGLDGSLKPLPHTQWGLILMAKSALVLAALAFGARNRLLLARNPTLIPADATRFRRSMRFEAAIMVAILLLSGFLANSPPAVGE